MTVLFLSFHHVYVYKIQLNSVYCQLAASFRQDVSRGVCEPRKVSLRTMFEQATFDARAISHYTTYSFAAY